MAGTRIHVLELENFKSYRGKVTIGPLSQFTCIVGPNGSGKSNTMDALSFVLGVRAAHMRGSNLKDLIYSVQGEKGEKKASVTLVMVNGEDSKISLKRTVKADGSSEYRIDDVIKSWEEYDEVLRGYNILTKAKNFLVFQGEVENLPQQSPKMMTALFEKISGSLDLKAEYEEKLKAKEMADQLFIDASNKRRGVGAEKNQYKMQKKEAERFKQLKDEQASIKAELALMKMYHIEEGIKQQKQAHQIAVEQLEVLAAGSKEEMQVFDAKRKEAAGLHKQSLALQGKHVNADTKRSRLQAGCHRLEASIKHGQDMIQKEKTKLKKIKEAGSKQSKESASLTKQLQDLKTDRDAYSKKAQKEIDEAEGSSLTPSQYKQWLELKEKANSKTVSMVQELKQMKRTKASEEQSSKSLSSKMENLETRKDWLESSIKSVVERQEQLTESVKVSEKDASEAKTSLKRVKEDLALRQTKQQTLENELSTVAKELSDLRYEKAESDRDRKFAQALDQMRQLYPGVKGKMTELARVPDKKYQTAVTVAMGKDMDAIVVDTDQTAMECISYLKTVRMPPMTFVPLESIKAPRIDGRLRNLGLSSKLVYDCIQFDQTIEAALRYAVGNTLVCDRMTDAKTVAFGDRDGNRHKVVTIDGSCILKNGCIQGGQATMEKRARKWDEHKYETVKRHRDELMHQLRELDDSTRLQNKILELTARLDSAEQSVKHGKADMSAADRRIETQNKELDSIAKQIKEIKPRIADGEKKLTSLEEKASALEKKKTAIEKEVFSDFEKTVKIKDIQEYEERRVRLKEERSAKMAEFNVSVSRVSAQIDLIKKTGTQNPSEVQSAIDKLETKLAKDTKEKDSDEKELKKASEEVEKLKANQEDIKNQMEEIDAVIKELRKVMGSKVDELGQAKKVVSQKEAAMEKLRSQRTALVQSCNVQEVPIPTMNAKRKAVEQGGKKKKSKRGDDADGDDDDDHDEDDVDGLNSSEVFAIGVSEGDASQSTQGEKMRIDFSNLSFKLKQIARSNKEFSKKCTNFEDELARTELELEKLAPNLKAMERFHDIEDKFGDSTKEFEERREEQKQADKEFRMVEERRHAKFMEMFDKIADEIDKVYKELTRDADSMAGGTAYLTVDNPEKPYLGGTKYNTIPPSKRFRDMGDLSGGERTIAAMALLFTMHRVSPSPFFILDEIDAALDATNVERACRYIRNHTDECQYLVITLKPEVFQHADSLVGVYKDNNLNASRVLTWDLTQYDEEDEN